MNIITPERNCDLFLERIYLWVQAKRFLVWEFFKGVADPCHGMHRTNCMRVFPLPVESIIADKIKDYKYNCRCEASRGKPHAQKMSEGHSARGSQHMYK